MLLELGVFGDESLHGGSLSAVSIEELLGHLKREQVAWSSAVRVTMPTACRQPRLDMSLRWLRFERHVSMMRGSIDDNAASLAAAVAYLRVAKESSDAGLKLLDLLENEDWASAENLLGPFILDDAVLWSQDALQNAKAVQAAVAERTATFDMDAKAMKLKVEREWSNLKSTYEAQLQLQTTTALWNSRSDQHSQEKADYLLRVIASFFLTPFLTFAFAVFVHRCITLFNLDFGGVAVTNAIVAFSAILALTLCLWTCRLLVRLYLTEHHLLIDAKARSAHFSSYLSLLADGNASDDDRKIILAELFRPVQDGLVDDALPLIGPAAVAAAALWKGGKS